MTPAEKHYCYSREDLFKPSLDKPKRLLIGVNSYRKSISRYGLVSSLSLKLFITAVILGNL